MDSKSASFAPSGLPASSCFTKQQISSSGGQEALPSLRCEVAPATASGQLQGCKAWGTWASANCDPCAFFEEWHQAQTAVWTCGWASPRSYAYEHHPRSTGASLLQIRGNGHVNDPEWFHHSDLSQHLKTLERCTNQFPAWFEYQPRKILFAGDRVLVCNSHCQGASKLKLPCGKACVFFARLLGCLPFWLNWSFGNFPLECVNLALLLPQQLRWHALSPRAHKPTLETESCQRCKPSWTWLCFRPKSSQSQNGFLCQSDCYTARAISPAGCDPKTCTVLSFQACARHRSSNCCKVHLQKLCRRVVSTNTCFQ